MPRRFSGKPRRSLFGGSCLGGGKYRYQDPSREKYCILFSVREDQSLYIRQSAPSERMGCLGRELQRAVVSRCSLLIARSCMHHIYMCLVNLHRVKYCFFGGGNCSKQSYHSAMGWFQAAVIFKRKTRSCLAQSFLCLLILKGRYIPLLISVG